MNLRDLPDLNDMYIQFRANYDYDKSFADWWKDMEEMFVEIVGEKQAEWLRVQTACNWSLSPTAQRILDDNFFDEIRKWRDHAVA